MSVPYHCQRDQGSPPTIREVAAYFGYKSTNNVRQHLRLIKRKGYIRLIPGKARGIEIVVGLEKDTSKNTIMFPS